MDKTKKSDNLKVIENLTKELLQKMGTADFKLEVKKDLENDLVKISISLDEPGAIIGFKGRTLSAFQLILGLMANSCLADYQRILVDVNNYRQEQDDRLKETAFMVADKAKETGQEVSLQPMAPYERRLIHLVLADDSQVETYSEGEGALRRVVVKPKKQ
jgi:spoIIIJ-associated protein